MERLTRKSAVLASTRISALSHPSKKQKPEKEKRHIESQTHRYRNENVYFWRDFRANRPTPLQTVAKMRTQNKGHCVIKTFECTGMDHREVLGYFKCQVGRYAYGLDETVPLFKNQSGSRMAFVGDPLTVYIGGNGWGETPYRVKFNPLIGGDLWKRIGKDILAGQTEVLVMFNIEYIEGRDLAANAKLFTDRTKSSEQVRAMLVRNEELKSHDHATALIISKNEILLVDSNAPSDQESCDILASGNDEGLYQTIREDIKNDVISKLGLSQKEMTYKILPISRHNQIVRGGACFVYTCFAAELFLRGVSCSDLDMTSYCALQLFQSLE